MTNGDRFVGSYLRRVLLYGIVSVVASSIGSLWTWTSNNWSNVNPLTDGLQPALFSLTPAILIVAAARLSRWATAWVAGSLFAVMVGMWWLFASSDSSTSALIFLWGWFAGVPIAAGVVIADWRHASGTALASATSN